MELYFCPMTCSLATRIALYELDEPATFHMVNVVTKKMADGGDYFQINPKGQVPALRTREGVLLTEGPAVLQYVADLKPERGLAPKAGTLERYQLQQWLNYISTEVHKQIFYTIFSPQWPAEAKVFVREQVAPAKYDFLSKHLDGREFLLDTGFTVADAYLVTTLNWCGAAGIDLGRWPVMKAYLDRMKARPAVGRAITEERALREKMA
ncbi:glutathione binding-like protein [Hyalangium minutum]|uniref:Glutathione S-transferase n=1 Tax=Hyalangium minutum TaxID=394096 RepID=A0A085W8F6_9BACT|nr:glutathione binding-like protein [Hyalangium minutum]KFE63969.1 Glutathione S-transferase [Hyalangium minutum]